MILNNTHSPNTKRKDNNDTTNKSRSEIRNRHTTHTLAVPSFPRSATWTGLGWNGALQVQPARASCETSSIAILPRLPPSLRGKWWWWRWGSHGLWWPNNETRGFRATWQRRDVRCTGKVCEMFACLVLDLLATRERVVTSLRVCHCRKCFCRKRGECKWNLTKESW